MTNGKPRQARKGAAVVIHACAEVLLVKPPPFFSTFVLSFFCLAMISFVLARKWRPHTFDTMVGQIHTVEALQHALSTHRLHHGYLFTGTHGTGKTSIARIFAKAMSCKQGVTPTPCGTCQRCQDIEAGRFVDLIEIDAASRSKVEDTREILDNILYPPSQGPYKIYLIDEVHMLSGHSFNALLKTLEEPPEHVKFLLATTEPKKLPVTVLSRCLQFHLKNITHHEMAHHLANILQKENISFEPSALSWVAQAANGSVRDALSLLDQAILQGKNQILEKNIREMLGYVETYYLIQLVKALIEKNGEEILSISENLRVQGVEPSQVLKELQKLFHQLTVIQCVPNFTYSDQGNQENYSQEMLTQFAKKISAEDLQLFYQIALKGFQDLSLAPTPWIAFEMTLLRMLAFQPGRIGLLPLEKEKINVPSHENNRSTVEANIGPSTKTSECQFNGSPTLKKLESSNRTSSSSVASLSWENILPALKLGGLASSAAQHCTIKTFTQDKLILTIPAQYETSLTTGIRKQIEESVNEYFLKNQQKNISIDFHITQSCLNSPAEKQKAKQKAILDNVQISFEKDPNLHKILEIFHGTIIPDSLKPLSN